MSLFLPGSRVTLVHGKPWKRTITMRGTVQAYRDGLLIIDRAFGAGGHYDSLGDPKLTGDYGTIEVVEGSWILRRVYYRASGIPIGELFNVQTPVEFRAREVRYTDLEVDVVRRPDGSVQVVDEDDLAAAVAVGGITSELAETARAVAYRLADVLRANGDWRAVNGPWQSERPTEHSP